MAKTRLFGVVVLAIALMVGIGTPAASAATAPSTIALLALNTGQEANLGDLHATHYSYVVVQQDHHSLIPTIHASTGTKAYMYLNAGSTKVRTCSGPSYPYDETSYSFGVDYCWIMANHPDWILTAKRCTTDAHGNQTCTSGPATYDDYNFVALDMGNPDYQKQWADDAVYAATAYPGAVSTEHFDGVYLDDVNTHPGHGLDQSDGVQLSSPRGTISDSQYGDDVVSFIGTVGDELKSDGLTSIGNVALEPWNATELGQAKKLAPHLTAVNKEFFSRWLDGAPVVPNNRECGPFRPMDGAEINAMQSYEADIQQAGAGFTSLDYIGNDSPLTARDLKIESFSRASFLLAWDGNAASATLLRPCGDVDPANVHWTTDLGNPTADKTTTLDVDPADPNALLLSRSYGRGLVVQNQESRTCTVHLDGKYTDQDGNTWTAAKPLVLAGTLNSSGQPNQTPGSAALLTKVGTMASPPPTLTATCS